MTDDFYRAQRPVVRFRMRLARLVKRAGGALYEWIWP